MGWRKYDRRHRHLLLAHLLCKVKADIDYTSSMHKPWTKTTTCPQRERLTRKHATSTWEERTRSSVLVTRNFVTWMKYHLVKSQKERIQLPTKECGCRRLSRYRSRRVQLVDTTWTEWDEGSMGRKSCTDPAKGRSKHQDTCCYETHRLWFLFWSCWEK